MTGISVVLLATVRSSPRERCRLDVQWVFYGHGTNWHPAYYPTLAMSALSCVFCLYNLRYRLATWESLPLVKLFTFCHGLCNVMIEGFLPLPGILIIGWLPLVPFHSPAASMLFMYFSVRNCPHIILCSGVLLLEARAHHQPTFTTCRLQFT